MATKDDDGSASVVSREKVLLVTAHPDDESMFFVPTIMQFIGKADIYVLCLSSGNYEGLGETRKQELIKCCAVLGILQDNIVVVEHPKLQDGMNEQWDLDVISSTVGDYIVAHGIDTTITFDDYGVSGHPNHIATHRGVMRACQTLMSTKNSGAFSTPVSSSVSSPPHPKRVLLLESTSLLRKYIGVLDLPLSYLLTSSESISSPHSSKSYSSESSSCEKVTLCVCKHPLTAYAAMSAHYIVLIEGSSCWPEH